VPPCSACFWDRVLLTFCSWARTAIHPTLPVKYPGL
jgi:hypothetical protein